MKTKLAHWVVAAAAAFGLSASADAALLATDWSFEDSQLYRIDTATASVTLIGATGQARMIGLVVDTDGTVYAISEEAQSKLWTLNSSTGAATLVGSLGFNLQEGDMTIDPLTGQMFVADGTGDKLYTVNKSTGAASLVGAFGSDGRDVSGLQFIGSTLYGLALNDAGADVLGTVDPASGAFTTIGATGTDCGGIAALGRDLSNGSTFMACPNTLFGNDNVLYSLNLATGAATAVGDLAGIAASISGFSTAGDAVSVPEPQSLALLGIGLLAMAALRRRNPGADPR